MATPYVYAGHEGFHEAIAPRLEKAGYKRIEDAASAEVVLTYCVSQTALEDAYFETEGFIATVQPGTVLVDLSPSTPQFIRDVNAIATVHNLSFVEAPLIAQDLRGAKVFTEPMNLTCFVAAEDEAYDKARPLLEMLVGSIIRTGSMGSAQLMRAAYTLQITAGLVSAIEADVLYQAAGRTILGEDAEAQAGCLLPQIQHLLAAIPAGDFGGAFTVEMLMAELSAAISAAEDADLVLPQAESAMRLLELLAIIGGTDKSPAALALIYSDEERGAEFGLDWSRAKETFGAEHDHDHENFEEDDDDDEDAFADPFFPGSSEFDFDEDNDFDYEGTGKEQA